MYDDNKMNDTIPEIIRCNIQRYRKRFGCTAKQLSELIGCDSSYISKVEKGRVIPSLEKLISIADYFKADLADLLKE